MLKHFTYFLRASSIFDELSFLVFNDFLGQILALKDPPSKKFQNRTDINCLLDPPLSFNVVYGCTPAANLNFLYTPRKLNDGYYYAAEKTETEN